MGFLNLETKSEGKKPRLEGAALVLEDGPLALRDRIYSVPHIAITLLRKTKGRAMEYEVAAVILAFELIMMLLTVYSLGLAFY